jgi:tetratricopeptide (TPR) repeat protein
MSGAAVLDLERNLVIGIVSETLYAGASGRYRDVSWAVDSRVLTSHPFNLNVQVESLGQPPAQQAKTDITDVATVAIVEPGVSLKGAPQPLEEWVGRQELLRAISSDWADETLRVTGLVGFGGEGKSSLVRRWLDELPNSASTSGIGVEVRADAVFWWGFYDKPNVEEFFEAALSYMSGGRIDLRQYPSSNAKAHLVAAMLGARRYLFILDGLEVMQYESGTAYGLSKSDVLREFLRYFAAPGHGSFCLITSRVPLLDLMRYTTYTQRDVDRLSPSDGRALLRTLGVDGFDERLDKVVADWDGHALSLSLLGTYLVDRYGGDIAHVDDIPTPTANQSHYERVHRVLRSYDTHLSEAERAFLRLFSVFRTPVDAEAIDQVFRLRKDATGLSASISALDDSALDAVVKRLLRDRILRHATTRLYTIHPLIRQHYSHLMSGEPVEAQAAHKRVMAYYLSLAANFPYSDLTPTAMSPGIEAVHHACSAGAYDEALAIYKTRFNRFPEWGNKFHDQGAFEADLESMKEFFPKGDFSRQPQVSTQGAKNFIVYEVAVCLLNLGQLQRAKGIVEGMQRSFRKHMFLTELYAYLGDLALSADHAHKALVDVRGFEPIDLQCTALCRKAWADHLHGDLQAAHAAFTEAETLKRSRVSGTAKIYLYGMDDVQQADHLRRAGDPAYAREITEANLRFFQSPTNSNLSITSLCHRILGDLDAYIGQHESARQHYNEALKIARTISYRPALIEALLARGRWYARHVKDGGSAFNDLNEALEYAVDGRYRTYEADIRVAVSWAQLLPDFPLVRIRFSREGLPSAQAEAEYARHMSQEMEYHWGQVDAQEVLNTVKS